MKTIETICKVPLVIASIIIAALFLSGCSPSGSSGEQFVGKWHRTSDSNSALSFDITITRSDSQYILTETETYKRSMGLDPQVSDRGTYSARYENGVLKVSPSIVGDVSYLKADNAILFSGNKYQKVN